MLVEATRRKKYLWMGLPLAVFPAVIFVPAFAFFTICPPFELAWLGALLVLGGCVISEVFAFSSLLRSYHRVVDWIGIISLLFISIPAVFLGLVLPMIVWVAVRSLFG
ncbi:MAG: hypothetical protein HY653_01230, partial [Acidobacteria bacterium]|nr:hypothetical protein [Acidobacteriota bacterium]